MPNERPKAALAAPAQSSAQAEDLMPFNYVLAENDGQRRSLKRRPVGALVGWTDLASAKLGRYFSGKPLDFLGSPQDLLGRNLFFRQGR